MRRDHNEDSFLVDLDLGLLVIADGMGGHAGGEHASRLAVETIQREVRAARESLGGAFERPTGIEQSPLPDVMRQAVEAASAAIFEAAQADPDLSGMGTTVTAALMHGPHAFVAHVGDSRCYLLRDKKIYQVSEDHSLVNEQIKAGAISPEEARTSRFKNIITRSVGFERTVAVDLMGIDMQAGDQLVVCCDGLSNMVEDAEILSVAVAAPPIEAAERLVALANERGGDDNITVIIARVEGPSGAGPDAHATEPVSE
ncbi:MAG: Stp1/IreP family PP2C-type Ser/Thr phosphatase [Anaeromyxobacteraceae bacterium]